jgi:ferric iron reductase protein FhuF
MIKKWMIIGGVISICILFSIYYYNTSNHKKTDEKWTEKEFMTIVNKHYMEPNGMIKSYGSVENKEYLLESLGLYMIWLWEHNQDKQVKKTCRYSTEPICYSFGG